MEEKKDEPSKQRRKGGPKKSMAEMMAGIKAGLGPGQTLVDPEESKN